MRAGRWRTSPGNVLAKRETDLRRLWKDVIEPVQEHFYALTRPGPSGLQSVVAAPLEGMTGPRAATPAAGEGSPGEGPNGQEPAGKDSGMRKVA